MHKRQITLADLAKELGISTATVSRALKDYPDISKKTKKKVLELAKKMNYRPNTIASGLRKRESKVIGVIIPEIVNHFFSSVIKGIMEIAYDADYRVMLCQSDESYEKEVTDANALISSRVDGILVSVAHETKQFDHFNEFRESGIPIVYFDKVPPAENKTSKVIVDDYHGAFCAVEHLIQNGCRNIAHFRGPLQASTSRNRYLGYKDALEQYEIPMYDDLIFDCQKITLEEGYEFANQLMEESPNCDAIFSVNDMAAIGAMEALKKMGKRIPEDIQVVGFSDWKISSILNPPLSSVAQPSLEMGRLATKLLLKEIKSQKDEEEILPETVVLKTTLCIRKSSSK